MKSFLFWKERPSLEHHGNTADIVPVAQKLYKKEMQLAILEEAMAQLICLS